MGFLENFCIDNTNVAISNAIIIFCILIAAGPLFNINYIHIFGYWISLPLLISYLLSFYLIYCTIVGLINIAKGNPLGGLYILNAFIMWLPTLVLNGLGYAALMSLLNIIFSLIHKIIP